MNLISNWQPIDVEYPDSDGKPVAETDFQRIPLLYAVGVLDVYFQNRPDVYVSGNICFYYEEGNPKAYLAPDVLVIFGIPKRQRRSYKVWEEGGKYPDFILEITSKSTVNEDQGSKKGLYAHWGVKEYFQCDPTADYLDPPLKGFTLVDGNYTPLPTLSTDDGALVVASQVLGLELRLKDGEFRFFDPAENKFLLNYQESDFARQQAELEAEEERQRAEEERQRAEEERQRAEEERQRADRLAAKLRELNIDPESI
jgi:Uma2 family endonuclease